MQWHPILSNDVDANELTGPSRATQSAPTRTFSIARSPELFGKPIWLDDETYSLLLLVGSSICYSVMGVYIKFAVAAGVPSTELVFLRALFQLVFIVVAMIWFRDTSDVDTNQGRRLIFVPFGSPNVRNAVLARGLFGGFGFLLYSYTISVLPLGDATTMLSLNPIMTVIAGSIFLGETIRMTHLVAALGSLIGCLLIAKPSFLFKVKNDVTPLAAQSWLSSSSTGYITGVTAACCGAAVYVLIRRAGRGGVHTLQLLFAWVTFGLFFSLLVGVVFPALTGQGIPFIWPHSTQSWMYILGVSVFGSMGHLLINYAARYAPAGLASIMRASGIMWSYCLQVLVFHEIPQTITTCGAVLILLSLVIVAVQKHAESHPPHRHITSYKHSSSSSVAEEEQHILQMEPVPQHPIKYGSFTVKTTAPR